MEKQKRKFDNLGSWALFVIPVLAVSYLCFFLPPLSFLEQIPAWTKDFKAGFWMKLFMSLWLIFVGAKLFPPREEAPQPTKKFHNLISIEPLRICLAMFLVLYAYLVATGLIPLEDQQPRIEFPGVLAVTTGLVAAFFALTSRYRLYLVGLWVFFTWVGFSQMATRIRFLEMMLEPNTIEKVTYAAMGLLLLVLMMPKTLRTFDQPASAYKAPKPLVFEKGIHF